MGLLKLVEKDAKYVEKYGFSVLVDTQALKVSIINKKYKKFVLIAKEAEAFVMEVKGLCGVNHLRNVNKNTVEKAVAEKYVRLIRGE